MNGSLPHKLVDEKVRSCKAALREGVHGTIKSKVRHIIRRLPNNVIANLNTNCESSNFFHGEIVSSSKSLSKVQHFWTETFDIT